MCIEKKIDDDCYGSEPGPNNSCDGDMTEEYMDQKFRQGGSRWEEWTKSHMSEGFPDVASTAG
jgi:hypothetical protein